jgi:hypothetical protein
MLQIGVKQEADSPSLLKICKMMYRASELGDIIINWRIILKWI